MISKLAEYSGPTDKQDSLTTTKKRSVKYLQKWVNLFFCGASFLYLVGTFVLECISFLGLMAQ